MIYIRANESFEVTLTGAPTNLVGTLGIQIVDGIGNTIISRTTSDIVEHPANSGIYTATLVSPDDVGSYVIVWDDGAGVYTAEELVVTLEQPVPPGPDPINIDAAAVVALAWVKVDDCFDSFPGGPHLREKSKTGWDEAKTALLLPYALARINYGNPLLSFTQDDFPYDTDHIVLTQALVIEIIKHLMRSYVEDPLPMGGGSYAYLSRRDYIERWKVILDQEEAFFTELVRMFRRKYLGLGGVKGLISVPRGIRGQFPYSIWRTRGGRFIGW